MSMVASKLFILGKMTCNATGTLLMPSVVACLGKGHRNGDKFSNDDIL